MVRHVLLPRLAEPAVEAALSDTPVVLVHGPRQCGKTTLATRVGDRLGYEYLTLDEDAVRMAARSDPAGFVAELPERVVIDEIQRVPDLFLAIKLAVDRRRSPGRLPVSLLSTHCRNFCDWRLHRLRGC